jgi:hypothetical protein
VIGFQALIAAIANGMGGSEVLVETCGGFMFSAAIQGLTLVSNAGHPGEVVALVREILVAVSEFNPR